MTMLERRALVRLRDEDYATVIRDFETAMEEKENRRLATEEFWQQLENNSGYRTGEALIA